MVDHEGQIASWLAMIPARKKPKFVLIFCGETLFGETDHGDQAAGIIADLMKSAVASAQKPLSFILRACDQEGKWLATFPVRLNAEEAAPTATATASAIPPALVAFIMELMAQNRATAKLLIDCIGPVLQGSAAVVSAQNARLIHEMERAERATEAASGAMELARESVAQTEAAQTQANGGTRPMIEKFVMMAAAKELGMDATQLAGMLGQGGGTPPAGGTNGTS